MIRICTFWRKHDSTIVALAVAKYLDTVARKYVISNFYWRARNIDPTYDSKVVRRDFHSWLSKTSHIIWTSPVDSYYTTLARKQGIRSTLYTSWDQLEPYDEKGIGDYTHVLVPTAYQAMQLRDKFKLRNIAVLPFDSGLPISQPNRIRTSSYTSIFLSLYGAQLRRVDLSAILLLGEIAKSYPQVSVTIACCKGLALYTLRALKQLAKEMPDRWKVLLNCAWPEQILQMGQHDLTVWPAKWDGFGIIGTTSLTMGTPVIAWDAPPMTEHLSAGRNCLLVPSEVEYNWLNVPHIKPNYRELDYVLRWLLANPEAITELKRYTGEQLTTRRDDFRKGWSVVLPTAV